MRMIQDVKQIIGDYRTHRQNLAMAKAFARQADERYSTMIHDREIIHNNNRYPISQASFEENMAGIERKRESGEAMYAAQINAEKGQFSQTLREDLRQLGHDAFVTLKVGRLRARQASYFASSLALVGTALGALDSTVTEVTGVNVFGSSFTREILPLLFLAGLPALTACFIGTDKIIEKLEKKVQALKSQNEKPPEPNSSG